MTDIVESIEADYRTELSRLGSSKALYALTDGEMEAGAILDVLATKANASHEIVDEWAKRAAAHDAASDDATAIYADAAATFANQYDELRNRGGDPAEDPGPVYPLLDDFETDAGRLGGLLGHAIVSAALLDQVVGFYVGNADPQTADAFRTMATTARDRRDRIAAVVAGFDDTDRERATGAAGDVIGAAYDAYVDRLEAMGVNPKPVC